MNLGRFKGLGKPGEAVLRVWMQPWMGRFSTTREETVQ